MQKIAMEQKTETKLKSAEMVDFPNTLEAKSESLWLRPKVFSNSIADTKRRLKVPTSGCHSG